MTAIQNSQIALESLVSNPRKLSIPKSTFGFQSKGTLTHAQVSQLTSESLLKANPSVRVSQLTSELLIKNIPNSRVSQVAVETLIINTPRSFKINKSSFNFKSYAVNLAIPFPSGLLPSRESYSFTLPKITSRTEVQGGVHRYGFNAKRGKQIHNLKFRASLDKLKEFDDFYYNKIQKGALDFSLNMDSGMGLSYHSVTMIPSTLKIDHHGFYADISFSVATFSQVLNMSQVEANSYLSAWNNNTAIENFTGGFIFTPRFPVMAPNSTTPRFNAWDWNVDFRLGAMATLTGRNTDAFKVQAHFRSNLDLVGIIYSSIDKHSSPVLRYDTEKNYTGNVTAFVDNPIDPYNNTMTITASDRQQYLYRLFPYYNDSGTLKPYVTDAVTQGTGPSKTYPLSQFYPSGVTVPSGSHIFILDFDNMYLGFDYTGAKIPVDAIETIFLSMVPAEYGIGSGATLANVAGESSSEWIINNVNPNLQLEAGNIITVTYTLGAVFYTVPITVTTWSLSGTTLHLTRAVPITGVTYTGGKCLGTKITLDTAIGDVFQERNITNIKSTGANAILGKYDYVQLENGMQIAEGLDDSYNLNPEKIADQIYKLGYRGDVTCYVGASHWYKAASYMISGVYYNRMDTTSTSPINTATVTWLTQFLQALKDRGLGFIWSTSLEILLSQINPDWAQKDIDDNLSMSGYTPPTSFLNFTMPEVKTYLINCIKQGLGIMQSLGIALKVQLGEWWSWDGSYSNGKPCIYAYTTKLKYYNETGKFAPTTIDSIFKNPITTEERDFCTWLGEDLGKATWEVRDALKAAYPSTLVCLLFFSPQIFNDQSVILPILNFPIPYWKYPYFDFMQIEDYDFISGNDLHKLPLTRYAATVLLQYPKEVIDYFVGFVNLQQDQYIWGNMHTALTEAIADGIGKMTVWALPQIQRDGIVDDFRLPRGLFFNTSPGSISITGADGVYRTKEGEVLAKSALQWKRGNRQISVTAHYTGTELKTLLIFLYHNVNLGTVTFSVPIDDGSGYKLNRVNIVPDSINIASNGFDFWEVSMVLEGEPGYFN